MLDAMIRAVTHWATEGRGITMTAQTDSITQYAIDAKASQFTVQAFAGGLISAVAHSPKIAIRDWTGDVSFVPDSLENATLKVVVKAAHMEVLDELRENDRRELHRVMNEEVLETRFYPEITYESTHISASRLRESTYTVNSNGPLMLHGITHDHPVQAQVAFGVDSFRAHGQFTLLQSEYGIKIVSIAGGTMSLRDQLKFTFFVVAHKRA